MPTSIEITEKIAAEILRHSSGTLAQQRIAEVQAVLDRVLPEYAAVTGLSNDEVLAAIEAARDYSAMNYYQDANFPPLDKVSVFDTLADFRAAHPSGKYTCPSCAGISTNPYECNAGTVTDGKTCNWKSYGLFGTMGKGMRVILKDKFLTHPRPSEIFMPVEAGATGDKA